MVVVFAPGGWHRDASTAREVDGARDVTAAILAPTTDIEVTASQARPWDRDAPLLLALVLVTATALATARARRLVVRTARVLSRPGATSRFCRRGPPSFVG